MRMALIGAAGFVGRAAADRLAALPDVGELLLVDYDVRAAKKLAKRFAPKARFAMADAGRPAELSRLLEGMDAVACAVGPSVLYDETVLGTCAASGTPVAIAGDCAPPPSLAAKAGEVLLHAGVPAVVGCGLLPGWTEILAAHFLPSPAPGAGERDDAGALRRFMLFSPDRFGGYAFFRRAAGLRAAEPPEGAPAGAWFAGAEGDFLGVPPGRRQAIWRMTMRAAGRLGPVGRELAAFALYRARGIGGTSKKAPAAVAGVVASGGNAPLRRATVTDPGGRLAGILLAETARRLAELKGTRKGLLPLPGLIGREEALELAANGGGRIETLPPSAG